MRNATLLPLLLGLAAPLAAAVPEHVTNTGHAVCHTGWVYESTYATPQPPVEENLFHIEFVVVGHYFGRHLAPEFRRDPQVGEHSGPGIVMTGLVLTDFGEPTGTLIHYHVEQTPYKNGAPMAAVVRGQVERYCV